MANAEARLDQLRGAHRRGEPSVGGLRVEVGGRATTFKTTIPNTALYPTGAGGIVSAGG